MGAVIRTLIVDDDVRVADIHRGYVEKVDGFEVAGIAHRGAEALQRVLDDEPDLILLDIYLPDLGGLEVCRRLRAAGNLTDVIAVTAARDVDTVRGAIGLGVAQYLVKPFAFATFREKLERYAAFRANAQRTAARPSRTRSTRCSANCAPAARSRCRRASPRRRSISSRARCARPEELGAAEVADAAGLSRVTARRYLEHLVEQHSVALELKYGGGRPEHRYRWAAR